MIQANNAKIKEDDDYKIHREKKLMKVMQTIGKDYSKLQFDKDML